jgi:hypothetical protein
MAKIIKKIGRVILILVAVLILVPAIAFLILQTPQTQTFAVNHIAQSLSKRTGAEITVGKVSYSFFRRIVLENVLVRDQNRDTLLAVKQVDLRMKEIKPSENKYRFGRADLIGPDLRMVTDTSGRLNLMWFINELRGNAQSDSTARTQVSFAGIDITDGSYSLTDMSDTAGSKPGKVNFKALRLSSLNGKIRDMNIDNDSVFLSIRSLSFNESCGFSARSVNADLTVADGDILFRDINLLTDSSTIVAERIFLMPGDSTAWSDFINRVRFDMIFRNSVLQTSDLAYFISPLSNMNETIRLSGHVSGTVSELKGRKINIRYATNTQLDFDFDISGLPSISDSYLHVDFKDMRTKAEDFDGLLIPGRKPVTLPPIVHDLGLITYRGSFTGFITDFVTFGKLTTERGSFSTDLSVKPDAKNITRFKGFLEADNIDLGYVTRNREMFGGLWLHADVDGSMQSLKHITANIDGVIDSVDINNYLYRNVSLEGTYSDRIWDGSVAVRDQNIKMDLLGRFDVAHAIPVFDFTLNLTNADLHRINLVNNDTLFRASALITASFSGNRIDNLKGDLRMINSTLENSNGRINIYDFVVSSGASNGVPLLTLKSDFADAELRGTYSTDGIKLGMKTLLAELFPSKYARPVVSPSGARSAPANFTLNARIKKIDKLSDFFGMGLSIAEGSRLNGRFVSDSSAIDAEFSSDAVAYAGTRLGRLNLKSSSAKGMMGLSIAADTLLLPDKSKMINFLLRAGANSDTVNLGITWNNNNDGRTLGEVRAKGFFNLNEFNRPVLVIGLLPTTVNINNTPWKISPAHIVVDSASAYFDNILVSSKTNYIRLDGRMSHDPADKLTLSFEGLNLAYLNRLINDNTSGTETTGTEMNLGGIMKGEVMLSDIYDEMLFESQISISDFFINNSRYGMVSVKSEWDPRQKLALIDASNDYEGSKYFEVSGTYNPSTRYTDITLSAFRMPLDILSPFVNSFATNLKGVGSGKIRLERKMKQILLSGSVMAEDASMKITYLQTKYSFSDSIRFTQKGIEFRNIKFYDEKKNQGRLNGILSHNSFKDIGINFDINMDKMLVLNTKPKDNSYFYGTAYATGYAGIRGTPEKLTFNISAKTNDNTIFYVPLNSSESVNDYPYIIFVDSKKEEEKALEKETIFIKKEDASQFGLNFDLEVTPEAEVRLIMDEKSGDVIRGKGSGKLNISLNDKGDLRMAGDYVIDDGDYLFTLGNILNKRFIVEQGGTISWNGPIDDAEINLKAIYKTKASLYDILPEDWLKERIPVECFLILSGKLLNPVVKFDINLPTADDKARETLKAVINTDEELSRQFLYLLVMNSFYPDPQLYNAGSKSRAGTTETQGAEAMRVTTIEMLSNQLSNWLSQISNDFDIGFNYRPTNEITQQEVEVALSTQLLNDKVILNGNVDVGGNQSKTRASNITGEFTIEFKITDQLRFKVFNRSNNDLFYEMPSPYTQGFGIFYRRDFDKLKDLFTAPENRKKKKAQTGEDADSR